MATYLKKHSNATNRQNRNPSGPHKNPRLSTYNLKKLDKPEAAPRSTPPVLPSWARFAAPN